MKQMSFKEYVDKYGFIEDWLYDDLSNENKPDWNIPLEWVENGVLRRKLKPGFKPEKIESKNFDPHVTNSMHKMCLEVKYDGYVYVTGPALIDVHSNSVARIYVNRASSNGVYYDFEADDVEFELRDFFKSDKRILVLKRENILNKHSKYDFSDSAMINKDYITDIVCYSFLDYREKFMDD